MEKFVPYEKLSKKKQRERNKEKRGGWGALNPITRKSESSKAYNRKKARQWSCEDQHDVPVFCGDAGRRIRLCIRALPRC